MVPLFPKIRGKFAEFLQDDCLKRHSRLPAFSPESVSSIVKAKEFFPGTLILKEINSLNNFFREGARQLFGTHRREISLLHPRGQFNLH